MTLKATDIHVRDLDPEERVRVEAMVDRYRMAKATEEGAQEDKRNTAEALLVVVKENGEQTIVLDDGGKVSYVHGHERTSYPQEDLRKAFLKRGVDPIIIAEAFDEVGKTTQIGERVNVR